VKSLVVVPVHPFRCGHGYLTGVLPGSLPADELLLVQRIDSLGGGIIVGISLAADRADRADILQPLGVPD
jgi:hypothetical protein